MEHLDYISFNQLITDIDNDNSNRKYKGEMPCIIDFYTTWCHPCKDVDQWLHKISEEFDGKIIIYKIDCEKEKSLAEKLNICSYPHLMFMKSNELPKSIIGLYPYQYLREMVSNELL